MKNNRILPYQMAEQITEKEIQSISGAGGQLDLTHHLSNRISPQGGPVNDYVVDL